MKAKKKTNVVLKDFQSLDINEDKPVYTSGVVCELLHIPIWILKQLDRDEVVCPYRKKGKTRLYSLKDLKKLKYVWYLMEHKYINVSGVKFILEVQGSVIHFEDNEELHK